MPEPLSDFTGEANPKTVVVGGVKLVLREFDMRTRALWMNLVDKYGLSGMQYDIQTRIIPKISNISTSIENDPRLRSIAARLEKLESKHDDLMQLYATPDEPDNIDELINETINRMEKARLEVEEMTNRIQDEVVVEAKEAEVAISEFMQAQDKARIEFVHSLAVAMNKTSLDFDEFFSRCGSEDYEAAERFVLEGNAQWGSLYNNRLQRTPQNESLPN